MPKFTYKGQDKNGESITETIEAVDRFAVYEIARTNGNSVSSIQEVKATSLFSAINVEKINALLSRVKQDELVMATRNLSSMLLAGLPLSRALSVIERQSKNPRMQVVMGDIRARISKGEQFHQALGQYPKVFSSLYTAMVRAGEESGALADALKVIALQLERSSSLTKKIKGAMIYPAIIIVVMATIGLLMMIFVMPTLITTFESLGAELPITTRVVIGLTKFITGNGLLTAAVAIGSVVGVVAVARTTPGRRAIHLLLTRMPVIGTMVQETNAARTARTLSSLLSSGVDVINALHITCDVLQNVYYKDIVMEATKKVEKGEPLSNTFIKHDKFYPILVGEMIAVGEETGQISKMLTEVADFYEEEVEQKTKDLSTIIEPILMVIIGASVGFFALAMIAPIYSIGDSL